MAKNAEEGTFRVSPDAAVFQKFKAEYNKTRSVRTIEFQNPILVAAMVKYALRVYNGRLIPRDVKNYLNQQYQNTSFDAVQFLQNKLDRERIQILADLNRFLQQFQKNVAVHKMNWDALAVVFAPNIFPDSAARSSADLLKDSSADQSLAKYLMRLDPDLLLSALNAAITAKKQCKEAQPSVSESGEQKSSANSQVPVESDIRQTPGDEYQQIVASLSVQQKQEIQQDQPTGPQNTDGTNDDLEKVLESLRSQRAQQISKLENSLQQVENLLDEMSAELNASKKNAKL